MTKLKLCISTFSLFLIFSCGADTSPIYKRGNIDPVNTAPIVNKPTLTPGETTEERSAPALNPEMQSLSFECQSKFRKKPATSSGYYTGTQDAQCSFKNTLLTDSQILQEAYVEEFLHKYEINDTIEILGSNNNVIGKEIYYTIKKGDRDISGKKVEVWGPHVLKVFFGNKKESILTMESISLNGSGFADALKQLKLEFNFSTNEKKKEATVSFSNFIKVKKPAIAPTFIFHKEAVKSHKKQISKSMDDVVKKFSQIESMLRENRSFAR